MHMSSYTSLWKQEQEASLITFTLLGIDLVYSRSYSRYILPILYDLNAEYRVIPKASHTFFCSCLFLTFFLVFFNFGNGTERNEDDEF